MNLGYTIPARLYPPLLATLPIGLAIAAWFPDKFVGYGFVAGLLATAGFTYLISQFGRDEGRRKQQSLWDSWGGAPTTQLLRHSNTDLNAHSRGRYHNKLAKIVPDINMPNVTEEESDPDAADAVYDSCTNYLLQQTRDTEKFSLLFKENVNYGFRRNLWGMKPAGIVLASIGLIVAAIPAALSLTDELRFVALVATFLNAILLVWWLFRINPEWVRTTAFAYAHQLLGTCEQLPDPPADPNQAKIHLP